MRRFRRPTFQYVSIPSQTRMKVMHSPRHRLPISKLFLEGHHLFPRSVFSVPSMSGSHSGTFSLRSPCFYSVQISNLDVSLTRHRNAQHVRIKTVNRHDENHNGASVQESSSLDIILHHVNSPPRDMKCERA